MSRYNPNLLDAAASPIMEVTGWVRDTPLPPERPLIDLSQAAPALPPHETILARIAEAVAEPSTHFYGHVLGNDDLRAAIAAHWSSLYDAPVRPEQTAITAGCNQAFCTAVSSACGPGDAVMLPTPWYFNHKMWLDMAGLDCVPVPVGPDMLPDIDAARAAMSDRVRAIALVTPNNPTGVEYPDELLGAFFDLASAHDAILIVDETYRDFRTRAGPPHTLFQRPDWDETLVHLYSFSKTYRLMGHRTGAIATSPARLAQAEKMLDTVTICPSQIGQIAALHGLVHLSNWVGTQADAFRVRREHLVTLIARDLPGWTLHGAGAYFAWITPPFDMPAPAFARRLLQDQSILVLPGTMFLPDDQKTGAVRIAFANVDEDGITQTVRRLAAFSP